MKSNTVKKGLAFLLAAIMTVPFVGCAAKQPAANTSSASNEKVTLEVMSWWDISKNSSLQQFKSKFESENPNITLDFPMIPGSNYYAKVLTTIASGSNIPDVMMLAADKLPMFASKNVLTQLDKYLTSDYKADTYPMVQNACKYNGKTFAVARDCTPTVMYFNTKMFKDANVDLPKETWTIDDFLSIAQKLTKTDASGKPTQWGYYCQQKYEDTRYDWMLLYGGDYATADGKKCQMNTEGTKKGLQFIQDMIYKSKVMPTDTQAAQFGTSATAPFVAGKAAMMSAGLSAESGFTTATPKVDFAVRPLPLSSTGKKVSHAFVNTWTIPKGAKNVAASWKALKFFSGKEGQQIALDNNMGMAANKKTDTSALLAQNADNKYLISALTYATPFRTLVYGADFYDLVNKELDSVWSNKMTVDQACNELQTKGQDILDGKSQQ